MAHRRSWFLAAALIIVFVAPAALPLGADQRAGAPPPTGGRTVAPTTRAGGSGTRGRSGRPIDEKSPTGLALAAAGERIKRINKAVVAFDQAAQKTMPKNLGETDKQQWDDVGTWIVSTKSRYAAHAQALTKATQTPGEEMDVLNAIGELDQAFLTLQTTVQEEAGKFTNLGKPAKGRYEAAMGALKGIK